jgi:hypothetical protein
MLNDGDNPMVVVKNSESPECLEIHAQPGEVW